MFPEPHHGRYLNIHGKHYFSLEYLKGNPKAAEEGQSEVDLKSSAHEARLVGSYHFQLISCFFKPI